MRAVTSRARGAGVANVHQVDSLDGEIVDVVDFVLMDHRGLGMCAIEIGHQKRLHGAEIAGLPAFWSCTNVVWMVAIRGCGAMGESDWARWSRRFRVWTALGLVTELL